MFTFLKKLFRKKEVEVDYPYLLSGENASCELVIRASNLPNIAVQATGPKRATVYVADHFKTTNDFNTLLSRLQNSGWECQIEDASSSEIRAKYHLYDDVHLSGQTDGQVSSNTSHFDNLLAKAVSKNASDIRFHKRQESCGITLKIDGNVVHLESISATLGDSLCAHLYANLADKTSHEKGKQSFAASREDQSCVIERKINGCDYKLRYQSIPECDGGYDVSMRIQAQGKNGEIPTLEEIGLPSSAISILRRASKRKIGAVIANGPQGSGKTTTLYCLLQKRQGDRSQYSMTLEDPVEFFQYGTTRVNVEKIGYVNAIKRALRLGADRMLVGEIRDSEMGRAAKTSQETGQKVFTTLHCNSAHYAISRLTDDEIGLKRSVICSTDMIALMFHQRLIPRLCECCKIAATTENLGDHYVSQLHRLGIPVNGIFIKQKGGCKECNGGTKGRLPVIELIEPDEHYMQLMSEFKDVEARKYWYSQCRSTLLDEDVVGKPVIANALYLVSKGMLDLGDVEENIDDIDRYFPTFAPGKTPLKVA